MVNKVEWADFVIVVCTETYNLRFRGKAPSGEGKGVKWEGAILTQELYETESQNTKFIPVVFSSQDAAYIPIVLKGQNYYDVSTDEGYEALYRHLTNQPLILKPALGKLKPMPPLKTKHDEVLPKENEPELGKEKKQEPERRDPKKTESKVRLRSEPKENFSDGEVKKMLKERDFFSANTWGRIENRQGKGLNHQYQVVGEEGEKLIIDHTTDLTWQQLGSSDKKKYDEAKEYIKQLNDNRFAGHDDWRLPTLEEAMSLMEPENNNANLYINEIFDKRQSYIWTADKKSSSVAWGVSFSFGYYYSNLVDYYDNYVRAVR